MKLKIFGICAAALLSASAFAARPVARWDVVPDQRVGGVFKAGVVAFHESGVRVEFAIGGARFTAANPVFNDRVGVWEYVCPVKTSALPDGPFTVKAKAVALSGGESYDLPELRLFANSGGTLNVASKVWVDAARGDDSASGAQGAPLKTLKAASKKVANGGTVYLAAGTYGIDGLDACTGPYWTTITRAQGVRRDDVELSPGRPGANHLRFLGVTFAADIESGYKAILEGENGHTVCWIDDCKGYNKRGRWKGNVKWFGNRMGGYFTGGLTKELSDGPNDCSLIRDHVIDTLCSDAWTGSDRLVVNCSCRDIDPGDTGSHPDFYQAYAAAPEWVHDVILYNVKGTVFAGQGLFGWRIRDSAFVNISIQVTVPMFTQWSGEMNNVRFWHVTLVDQSWLWRDGFVPQDVSVKNCLLRLMSSHEPYESLRRGLTVDHCAFYATDDKGKLSGSYGDDAIGVKRCFRDEAKCDYTPVNEKALTHGVPLQCVPADIDGRLYAPGPRAVGAFTPAQ